MEPKNQQSVKDTHNGTPQDCCTKKDDAKNVSKKPEPQFPNKQMGQAGSYKPSFGDGRKHP